MSLFELLIAILYIFLGLNTAILVTNEFNIFIGILSFFMTTYVSYYLLFVLTAEIFDYSYKCKRRITKLNKNKISKQDKIFWWSFLSGILIGIIVSYITIPLIGYISFIISLILGNFLYLIWLYFCYGLKFCKRKNTTNKEKS